MTNINDIVFSPNFPEWAKPEKLDVTFVDMSDANISYAIKVPADIDHVFEIGWWISVRGEKFYTNTLKPVGYKDDKSLLYNYTLILSSERSDLKRYMWVDIDKRSGVPLIKSYLNVFRMDIREYVDRFNDNLKFYGLSNRWELRLDSSLPVDNEGVLVDAQNIFLWDLLQRTTEIFGDSARWFIQAEGDKLIIMIGTPALEINHIFRYGGDTPDGDGGLTKIERTLSAEKLTTLLMGRGGDRNVPFKYFKQKGDNYPGDPDYNKYTEAMYITNLMPKCFRDYNRGWNSKVYKQGETWAYNQGVQDIEYRPVEWVKSDAGIAKYGNIWDKVEPNEEIYPTIQNISADEARAAGIPTTASGLLNEIIAVLNMTDIDDPNDKNFKDSFLIWIKDIGFDLNNRDYWAQEEMSVVFSSGWLAASEDYEFRIAAEKENGHYKKVHVYKDTTKINFRGERSMWRIKLMKSDAELNTTGLMIPNSGTLVSAGDMFFFTNITLPHTYIKIAENKQENHLKDILSKIDNETPVYSVKPDKIFCASFDEADKLMPGAIVRIANDKLIDSIYESLHIQSLTLKYAFNGGKFLPDWEMVVTDKILSSLNAVQRVNAQLASLTETQLTDTNVVAKVGSVFDKRYLRKDGVQELSNSPTYFSKSVGSYGFKNGVRGWGINSDENGNTVIETDRLIVRKDLQVNTLSVNQVEFITNTTVFSNGGCIITDVTKGYYEPTGDIDLEGNPIMIFIPYEGFVRCYYDNKNGSKYSGLKKDDQVRCQRYDPTNTNIIKYYWSLIVKADIDYVDISTKEEDNDTGSAAPEAGDHIAQFGNKTDKTRQAAKVIDIQNKIEYWYNDIKSYILPKPVIRIGELEPNLSGVETNNLIMTGGVIQAEDGNTSITVKKDKIVVKGVLVQSESGDDNVIGVWRGEWNKDYVYFPGDEIFYKPSGSSYRCKLRSWEGTLPTDTNYWELTANKGSDGANGANGADGANGKSVSWKGDRGTPPSNPEENWAYRNTIDGIIYIYANGIWEVMVLDGSDGVDGANGTNGTNGLSVFITYHKSETEPAVPQGDGTTDGWSTIASKDVVWMSQKVAENSWVRSWGKPIRIKGDIGQNGNDGAFFEYRYAKNGSASTAPALLDRTATNPAGWTVTIPEIQAFEYVWSILAKKASDGSTVIIAWSNPKRVDYRSSSGNTALINRGTWTASASYQCNYTTVSAVIYNGVYYISRVDAPSSSASGVSSIPTNTSYWYPFGMQAENIATGLLLAEKAYIQNLIATNLATRIPTAEDKTRLEIVEGVNKLSAYGVTEDIIAEFGVLPREDHAGNPIPGSFSGLKISNGRNVMDSNMVFIEPNSIFFNKGKRISDPMIHLQLMTSHNPKPSEMIYLNCRDQSSTTRQAGIHVVGTGICVQNSSASIRKKDNNILHGVVGMAYLSTYQANIGFWNVWTSSYYGSLSLSVAANPSDGRVQILINNSPFLHRDEYQVIATVNDPDGSSVTSGMYAGIRGKQPHSFWVVTGDDSSPNGANVTIIIISTASYF